MITKEYILRSDKKIGRLTIALVSDLHDRSADAVKKRLAACSPDIIAVAGDLTERIDTESGRVPPNDVNRPVDHSGAFDLLGYCASLAPTFYSLGNHELCGHWYLKNVGRKICAENLALIKKSGAVLLDDAYVDVGGVRIGGLTTGHTNADLRPLTGWLDGFDATDAFKILLCHHPEYYPELKKYRFDLMLSGHAHGGQIKLFGRGVLAPGQGFFPKYVSGVHDERLVIGCGLSNTARPIPRLFNPTELVVIRIVGK